jgi:dihydroflavonol-4-reductase
MSKILVTGATGFIASHIIKLFLNEGYLVKGTVRNLNDERIDALKKFDKYSKLEIIAAELLDSSSMERATRNVDIVIHTATTVIMNPTDEQSVLRPSIEGTMNVLNAAFKSNVKRFIYTSSSFAVTGHDNENRLYTDKDWADVIKLIENLTSKYIISNVFI